MAIKVVAEWMINLEDEDISFIKKFLLASGSLKEVANHYEVTYPTVRLRLDKLIQKIQVSEDTANEPYVALIKRLALDDKLDFETAKLLISEYKKLKGLSNMRITVVMLFIVMALLIGAIFLQIFLSKKKSKWFGLILPTISFIYSLLMISSIVVFDTMRGGKYLC